MVRTGVGQPIFQPTGAKKASRPPRPCDRSTLPCRLQSVAPRAHGDELRQTTQVAPTILKILGLDPNELDSVRKEGTPVLPELRFAE